MVKTSEAVRNISRKNPCETEVPALRAVLMFNGPGKRALTTPAEAIAPTSCEMVMRTPRIQLCPRTRHNPSVTAGLKTPLILKNAQALAASEKPKHKLTYKS